MQFFKRIFISGFTFLIPLAITIYILGALFHFADSILGEFINNILYQQLGYRIPGLGIVFFVLIVFIVGIMVEVSRLRFFRWFSSRIERFFFSIPLVKKIYSPVRQLVSFVFFQGGRTFKNTVLVEYPRKGIYTMGFLTNENSTAFKQKGNEKYYNIFIPSSPSPLTGFTIIVSEHDIVFLDIPVDEAIKLIISGGLLNPGEE